MTGERAELVEGFLQPTRLKIVALLSGCASAQFRVVRDRLELSDSLLSKHVSGLKKEGFVTVRKSIVGSMPQTWLSLTWRGRRAFVGHVAALQKMADDVVWPAESQAPD
ncbi:transcriptional regulator [Streptomyces silvisoli]|uniref:Transcriptional regulator n=1 Tax=Streptomyces silvisoli TaxID=3034235 RepID=A0ABT5ZNM3_9ACTN|nr:transcriptional regulator [Streptomyces silvisoli]MDF3291421.1 transcriptional regulator [Streptomyces silvisoli]